MAFADTYIAHHQDRLLRLADVWDSGVRSHLSRTEEAVKVGSRRWEELMRLGYRVANPSATSSIDGMGKVLLMTLPGGSLVGEALDQRKRGKRNPVDGLSYTTMAAVKLMRDRATEYGTPALVKVFPESTASQAWERAKVVETKAAHGTELEVFGVVDRPRVYGFAPNRWVDEFSERARDDEDRARDEKLAKSQRDIATKWERVGAEYGRLGEKYVAKLETVVGEYEDAARVVIQDLQRRRGLTADEKSEVAKTGRAVLAKAGGMGAFAQAVKGFIHAVTAVPEPVEYTGSGARKLAGGGDNMARKAAAKTKKKANPPNDVQDVKAHADLPYILGCLNKHGVFQAGTVNGTSFTIRRHDDGDHTAIVLGPHAQQGPEVVLPDQESMADAYHYALHYGTLAGWAPGSQGIKNPGAPHTHFKQLVSEFSKRDGVTDPKALAAWIEKRKRGAGWPKKSKNPESEDASPEAAAMYETFHGAPSEETLTYTEEDKYEDSLSVLGEMVSIKLETQGKKPKSVEIDFNGSHVLLTCNPAGTQLHLIGGDQSVELEEIGLTGDKADKGTVVLGTAVEITYRTQKAFDGHQTIDYYHQTSEETKDIYPTLTYDVVNQAMHIVGGAYRVEAAGICN